MDLSPAEEAVIGLLRGEQAVDFTLNVAWIGPVWTVAITSEGDGILAGRGDTFRQALHAAFGVTAETPDSDGGEGCSRAVMRLVVDHTAPAGSMRRDYGAFKAVCK